LRFEEPFYYGQFHRHVYVLMFGRVEGHSLLALTVGRRRQKEEQTANPAWDFQYLVPKYEV
jgi:hypothetical protein